MRWTNPADLMRTVTVIAVFALGAAAFVPRYASQMSANPAPFALAARPLTPVAADPANSRSVVVPRDARGHFEVDARVNGRRVGFMVDTGASVIALTARDAARIGIHPAQNAFVADVVEVGDLAVRDVDALVLPDEALSENLLGLSFLSRLRRFEYSEGKLVLEQ